MKYFEFDRDTSRKVIGKNYCQTAEVFDLNFKNGIPYINQLESLPNYLGKIKNYEFPECEPRIKFLLNQGSKLTDVMNVPNTNSKGLFISPQMKELMESFNLLEHKFYLGELFVEEVALQYYWFHPVVKNLNWIDFSKSVFSIMDTQLIIKEIDETIFGNEKEYHNFRRNNRNDVRLKKIYLNNPFFNDLDFFYLPGFQFVNKYFISERLKLEMEKKKITGAVFKEQPFIEEF